MRKVRILLVFLASTYFNSGMAQIIGENDEKYPIINDPLITTEEEFHKLVSEYSEATRNAMDDSYDQLIKNISPLSPQAEAIQKYGEFPMDYSTGTPHISIPLYEIKVGNYTLPISISYHASGIKVQDMATPVGIGWTLNAGGVINRQCKGTQDIIQSDTLELTYKTEQQIDYAMAAGSRTNYWWSRLAHKGEGDTESDRYTYSLNGKSGVFRYCVTDQSLRTIPTSDVKIENNTNGGYKITDTDGTIYYFTYGETNSDYSSSTLTATTTWYLTRIEPSTSTIPITFTYSSGQGYTMSYITQMNSSGQSYELQQNMYGDYDMQFIPYYNDSHQSYRGLYHGTVLLSQISWSGNTIAFNYAQDRLERGWGLDRLTSIVVKYHNQTTVRTVTFDNNHYLGTSQSNYRMQLQGLTIQGSSSTGAMTYGFNYDSTTLPNYFIIGGDQSCHEDYWGYYNGTSQSWIPSASYLNTYSTSNRAPNAYMTAGSLTRITYPTDGWTELEMEPNALQDNRTWGGLRVKKITNKDSDGTILCRKTYQYEQGYPAQNVTDDLFSYSVEYSYGYRDIRALQWHTATRTIYQNSPILSLTGDWGHPVYYKKVTEYIEGQGKTEYFYDEKRCSLNNMEDNGHIYDPPRLYSVQYNFDQGIINPTLTGKIVYVQNGSVYTPVMSESYTYTEVYQDPFRLGVRFEESNVLINYGGISVYDGTFDNSNFHHDFIYSDVWAIPSFFHLTSKSVTDYNNLVTTTTTYGYDGTLRTHQPVSESVTVSNGDVLKTSYTYPATATGTTYNSLVAANMHVPVGKKTTRGYAVVDSTRTVYAYYTSNHLLLPSALYIAKGTNTPQLRIEYDYDSFGNLAYIEKDGTDKTVFLWGYQGLYPVAKIIGQTKGQVYTTLGNMVNTLAGTPTDSQISSINSTLGTSALVTTYTYTPLIGITSIQSPRGENTFFSYDSMGRLSGIADHHNHIIESYAYSYGTHSYVQKTTMTNSSGNGRVTKDYYDGLGRHTETVAQGQSPTGLDIVSFNEYDALDRPVKQYLPISYSNSGNYLAPSTFQSTASTFYSDSYPYSETIYESCPSDKPIKQFGPGGVWRNNDSAVKKEYTTNSNTAPYNCRYYEVLSSGLGLYLEGNYTSGDLFVVKTTDEDENVSLTFTDKEGRLILERRMKWSTPYDTYYVYDIYGNLAFVLPPAASDALTETDTNWYIGSNSVLQQYAYHYRYDQRNRCIVKKLPGCGNIQMTYDTADRLSTRQDGNGITTYYEYDNFGRQTEMGIQNTGGSHTRLITNYYDDYSNLTANGLGLNSSGGGDVAFSSARGMLTGTKIAQLNNPANVSYTSYYYGDRERLVQSHQQNHLGGYEDEYYTYNFTGTTATKKHIHSATGQSTQTELYTYTYDGADRLLSTTHKLNNDTPMTLSTNTYDAVGRLYSKQMMDGDNISYTYNVRSWLTGISSTNFIETLAYNSTVNGLTPGYDCHGGDIAAMRWKTSNENFTRGFQLYYNPLGWLTHTYTYKNDNEVHNFYVEYNYDKMGNMTDFWRGGYISPGTYDHVDMPELTFNGNQMTRVDDYDHVLYYPYNGSFHFVDAASQDNEYTYDQNGNMTQDLNRKISSIQYNLLNLPQNITYSNNRSTTYVYDATGRKLQVEYVNPATTIDYCGNMIYVNGTLDRILIDGGYIEPYEGEMYYSYYLKDHQGNNRVVAYDNGVVAEVNHYYPFGLLFGESEDPETQKYKYNGKEFDRYHGLDMYDYGARFYDPSICRFTTMDPMCEKYYHLSPYIYCGNNPVNYVDPDGKRPKAREAALMAAYAYRDNNAEKYIKELNDTGWRVSNYETSIVKNYTHWYENGLQSELFERTINGETEYAYAFAGSNSIEDVVEDVIQLVGMAPQYGVAISNARILSDELGKKELTFVGHSLGGGEASAASMATGRSAITFNPASISKITSLLYNLGGAFGVTNYRTVGQRIGNTNLRYGGDPINNIQDNLGIGASGYTIPIYTKYVSHSINEFFKHDLPER
jgi:RHS repeat-associated protein